MWPCWNKTVSAQSPTDDLLRALEVYHGELLPGFYDEWVEPERERLQALYEHALTLLLDRLVAEQRWPAVLEWADRWIALGQRARARLSRVDARPQRRR